MMASFTSLLLPIGLIVLMYFFLIRPQKKQEKETARMRNNLVVGDEISTVGGLVGRIVKINEEKDIITIETGSDKNKLKVFRWAVRNVEVPFNDNSSENE
ncbi:MAG: preprotein translocase subunit YajC [Clostridia bacterium]|nr:preprotein translocase subunit YajC [Clostridia bacterium]